MSSLAKYTGQYGPLATIVNYFSAGGVIFTGAALTAGPTNSCKEFLPGIGSVTAGTLATAVSLSGRGRVNLLTAYTKDTTSRTVRCQVIVDGVTVFDSTSSATTTLGAGMIPIGTVDSNGAAQQFGLIVFNSSFVVKLASSVTEADKVAAGLNYETWS